MEKITLKLGDVLQLESEINGYVEPQSGDQIYEGFTKQNLSIILKYELSDFSTTLKTERTKIDSLRDELIKKYGEDDGKGGLWVKMHNEVKDEEGSVIGKVLNPINRVGQSATKELSDLQLSIKNPVLRGLAQSAGSLLATMALPTSLKRVPSNTFNLLTLPLLS